MPQYFIEESNSKSLEEQKELLTEKKGYQIPRVLEAVAGILTLYSESEELHSFHSQSYVPNLYLRCEEESTGDLFSIKFRTSSKVFVLYETEDKEKTTSPSIGLVPIMRIEEAEGEES